MADLVDLAALAHKDKFAVAQESFQAHTRAESIVRAANSLRATTHAIKLLLLLSDSTSCPTPLGISLRVHHLVLPQTQHLKLWP